MEDFSQTNARETIRSHSCSTTKNVAISQAAPRQGTWILNFLYTVVCSSIYRHLYLLGSSSHFINLPFFAVLILLIKTSMRFLYSSLCIL